MYAFYDFWLYILYVTFFVIFYFLIEKLLSLKIVISIKKFKNFDSIASGSLLALVTIVMQYTNKNIDNDFNLPLLISTSMILLILKDYIASLSSLAPVAIYYIFTSPQSNDIYILFISIILILGSLQSIKVFAPNKYKNVIYLAVIFFMGTTLFITNAFLIGNTDVSYSAKTYFFPYIFPIFGYAIMKYIINFSISSGLLYESSNYSFLKYYRSQIAIEKLNEFIYNHKVKKGYLIIFKISKIQNTNGASSKKIAQTAYENIQQKFSNEIFLFSVDDKHLGIFYPIVNSFYGDYRKNSFELRKIEDALNFKNKEIKWSNDKENAKIEFNFGISIYGVDDSSVRNLIGYSMYALKNNYNEENKFFYYKNYKSDINENILFDEMDKVIFLDNYSNYFMPIYDLSKKMIWGVRVNPEENIDNDFFEDGKNIVYGFGWETMFDRFYAADALSNAHSSRIVFDYSAKILNENFNINKFLSFFRTKKIAVNNVFIVFKKEDFNQDLNYESLIKFIRILNKHKLKFIFPGNLPKSILQKLPLGKNYTYFKMGDLMDEKIPQNLSRSFVFGIKDESQLKIALDKKINYLSGSLFDKSNHFKIFNKKSKILIDNLIRRANE